MSNPIFKKINRLDTKDVEYINSIGLDIPTKAEFPFLDVETVDADEFSIIVPIILVESNVDSFDQHYHCFIVSKSNCFFISLDSDTQFIDLDEDIINASAKNGLSAFFLSILSINEQLRNKIYKSLIIDILNMSQKTFNYEVMKEYDPRSQLKKYGRYRDIIDITIQYFEAINLGIENIQVYFKDSLENDKTSKFYALDIQRKIIDIRKQYLGLIGKITFLMDATLGFMSIEQNNITKVLTLASTILVMPTLVAGLFGMNFVNIPLMNTSYGFWVITIALAIAGAISFFYMKKKGWAKLQ